MQRIQGLCVLSALFLGACASPADDGAAAGEADLQGESSFQGYDGPIAPARMKFALAGLDLVASTQPSQVETNKSSGASGRTMQLTLRTPGAAQLPALALVFPAENLRPQTLDCATTKGLVFVGILPIGTEGTRTTSFGTATDGTVAQRSCSLTFEQAIEWGQWAQSWTVDEKLRYQPLTPPASVTRTLLRARFEADLGPKENMAVTTHVSGAFDLWDNKDKFSGI